MLIDLRSDTVTRPTPSMREAMAAAAVGDDVYGEDPTVNELEEFTASLLGKAAGLFVPSGTQSNLCALLAHCERGDEYIVGQTAHTYKYEAGGAAVLGSIQPQPLRLDRAGQFDLAEVEAAIKPPDTHFANTVLLALENTKDGHVLDPQYVADAAALARRRDLRLHLDGARLWNAAAAAATDIAALAEPFDTVSVCLSKGLGAPVGSVLVGDAARVASARRWRKMLGGGMRQAGILAAACRHALDHHRDRLVDDHRRAEELAASLQDCPGIHAVIHATNMVFVTLDNSIDPTQLAEQMRKEGVHITPGRTLRLVTHLDITDADLDQARTAFATVLQSL
ncbi:MAG: low-specificity L-threonine aldolase [Acidimicrobiales bacterium]|nr:low-specificity L-threonine aldolase [Acidimicrobiales bacterium]